MKLCPVCMRPARKTVMTAGGLEVHPHCANSIIPFVPGRSWHGWGLWRCGYSESTLHWSEKCGKWWIWVGPYLIGKPDETW